MPQDFLVSLKAHIDAFDAAVVGRNHSAEARVKAIASVADALEEAMIQNKTNEE